MCSRIVSPGGPRPETGLDERNGCNDVTSAHKTAAVAGKARSEKVIGSIPTGCSAKTSSDQPEHGRSGEGSFVFVHRARRGAVGGTAQETWPAALDDSLNPLVMLALTFM